MRMFVQHPYTIELCLDSYVSKEKKDVPFFGENPFLCCVIDPMADFFGSQVEFINHDAKWAILQSMMSVLTFHRFFMILGSDAEDYSC